jgi:hypothetical protein
MINPFNFRLHDRRMGNKYWRTNALSAYTETTAAQQAYTDLFTRVLAVVLIYFHHSRFQYVNYLSFQNISQFDMIKTTV